MATGDDDVNEGYGDWAIRGAFFRLNYTFKDRYIIEFNGRYDGTSRFPKESRFGFFPSASAAWRVDKEGFMNSLEHVISTLKIRGSYGSLGNQNVSNYGYIASMEQTYGNGKDDEEWDKLIIDGELAGYVNSPGLVSDNYTWEKVSTINGGVDLGFFSNKLYMSFDIYQRNTMGMLIPGKDLPDVLGADEPKENSGDLQTNGWELALSYKQNFYLLGKPFNFNTRFILSDSRAWITKFDNPNKDITQYYEGYEFGEMWGFESDGFFKTVEETQAQDQSRYAAWGVIPFSVGTVKWVDQDGNGIIEKGWTLDDPKDGKIIGNTSPRYRFGINLNFEWNGIDLSTFIQGIGKKDHYPTRRGFWGTYADAAFDSYEFLYDYYRPEDDTEEERAMHSQSYIDAGLADANLDAEFPLMQAWNARGYTYENGTGLGIPQTDYLMSAAYVRLKNVTLGYTLPRAISRKIRIQSLRIFVSGENITEWSPVKFFMDPEEFTTIPNGNVYPFRRRYSLGVNVKF